MHSKSGQRFILAFQEALIALSPYIILASTLLLLSQFLDYTGYKLFGLGGDDLEKITVSIRSFVSLAVTLTIAYHFSRRYEIDRLVAMLLSMSLVTTVFVLDSFNEQLMLPMGVTITSLITPIVSVLLLKWLKPYFNIDLSAGSGGYYVCRIYQYIFSFLIAYFLFFVVYVLLLPQLSEVTTWLRDVSVPLPDELLLLLRTVSIQILWFFGLHGPHIVNSFSSTGFLTSPVVPGLSHLDLYRMFAINGGSGMGLSLLIALYLNAKDSYSRQIAKLSTPFVIFNINTLIIYALPVVLNRYLLIPFMLVPLFNTLVALLVVPLLPLEFTGGSVTWTTPVFIDSYLVTGGSFLLIPLQVFFIVIGVLFYLPFVKRYSESQSSHKHLNSLSKNLGIADEIKAEEGFSLFRAHRSIIESNFKLEGIIGLLSDKDLMVYYQPKIDLKRQHCKSYEALLRLRKEDGQVVGPFFLKDIETAGLAPVLDLWVCRNVKQQLETWKKDNFEPHVSINLHPDTLKDASVVKNIARKLKGWPVEFEILERALVENGKAQNNLKFLKKQGFEIAIDDFGVGYSSYEFISYFDIDTIKLDKSIIDRIEESKGYIVCKHIITLTKDLNCNCVAEGVETRKQLELLRQIDVHCIQGWYYSKALPADEAINYQPDI